MTGLEALDLLLRPVLYTIAEERVMERLKLGPVPIRWVRTSDELDAFRRLSRRDLVEFDNASKCYSLTTKKEI